MSMEGLLRCQGLDVLAGTLAEGAMLGGLDAWAMIDIFAALGEEIVRAHSSDADRGRALVMLQLAGIVRRLGSEALSVVAELVEAREDTRHAPLTEVVCAPVHIAMSLVAGKTEYLPERRINIEMRELVRAAYDLGGIERVRVVVESLQAKLAHATGGRS